MHCLIPFGPWSSLHTDSNDFHFLCRSHWSTMQTLHRPDATVLPCLTGQQSVFRISLNLNPGLPHSSLIQQFNHMFLFLDSEPTVSPHTGKVINLLVHSTDARFLSLSYRFLFLHWRGVTLQQGEYHGNRYILWWGQTAHTTSCLTRRFSTSHPNMRHVQTNIDKYETAIYMSDAWD